MDVLIWILVVFLWLPAGYLGARFINAISGEVLIFDWKKPSSDPQIFGLGVFLGGLTLAIAICAVSFILFILGVSSFCDVATTFLGRFAPKR